MADDIFVEDLRASDDPSLEPVPYDAVDTYAKLQSVFHLGLDTSKGWSITPPGALCYKIVGFYLRTGPKAYIPKTRTIDGDALPNIVLVRSWPGAPALPAPVPPSYFTNGAAGFTNENGDIGFEYTGTSAFGPDGGPDNIWCAIDPPGGEIRYADCAVRLGWHGATNHLTPNPIFQVVRKQGQPSGNGKRIVIYGVDGSIFGVVPVLAGEGPANVKKMVVYDGDSAFGYSVIEDE